jgi:hypothetical protein
LCVVENHLRRYQLISVADYERAWNGVERLRGWEALTGVGTDPGGDPDIMMLGPVACVPTKCSGGAERPAGNAEIEIGKAVMSMVYSGGHVVDLGNTAIVGPRRSTNPAEVETQHSHRPIEQIGGDRPKQGNVHRASMQRMGMAENNPSLRRFGKVPASFQFNR